MNMSRWVDLESSAKMLLLSNLFTIFVAILFRWSILTLLWGYWLQSIIIGLFTVVKLLMFGYRNKHQRLLLTAVRDSIFFFSSLRDFSLRISYISVFLFNKRKLWVSFPTTRLHRDNVHRDTLFCESPLFFPEKLCIGKETHWIINKPNFP